jgi:hypothetical protein
MLKIKCIALRFIRQLIICKFQLGRGFYAKYARHELVVLYMIGNPAFYDLIRIHNNIVHVFYILTCIYLYTPIFRIVSSRHLLRIYIFRQVLRVRTK